MLDATDLLVCTRYASDASLAALSEQFGVPSSSLRVYVHYQPTYYHFHVHFSHVKMNNGAFVGRRSDVRMDGVDRTLLTASVVVCMRLLQSGTFTGKAVLLEDIISNLSQNGDHYKRATMSVVVGELQHKPLVDLFWEKGVLKQ